MKELIFSNSGTELLKVRPEDIVYIEAEGNYCRMYLRGGFEQQLWFNRQKFISIISDQLRDEKPTFIVVGRSYVINLAYIFRINPVQGDLLLFDSCKPLQISLHASQLALNNLKEKILTLNHMEDYER
jgi:DNA-binding LytR/AlgR family response regulator